jgi:hypothetical protein
MKKGSLAKRAQQSFDTRDKGGNQSAAFDWKKIQGEIKFYKPKEGKNYINIIPYEVKTTNHPLVRQKEMEIGDLDYLMDIWLHKGLGPSQTDVICPKKNYGKPCPACEAASKAYNDGDKELGGDLKASRRVLYNVVDTTDPESGVQVFDVSHFLFEKELIEAARDEAKLEFADPDQGDTITFRAVETTKGKMKFLEFKGFAFTPRKVRVEDADLDDAISFDEILRTTTAEEITKIMYGADDDDEPPKAHADSDRPARGSRRATQEPEGEPEEPEEPEPEEKPARASRRAAAAPEPEPEEPASRASRRSRQAAEEAPEPEPATARKSQRQKTAQECPSGYEFGKDNDEYEECDKCELWDACARAQTSGGK